jgi:hypothetical protein
MADKDVLLVVDVFSNEKDIEKEIIFQAIESALESATVSRYAFLFAQLAMKFAWLEIQFLQEIQHFPPPPASA